MKTIKQYLLTILLIALAGNVLSQESRKVRGDSIRIRFDDCLLEVATFDLKVNTLEKAEVQQKINELLKELKKVEINIPDEGEKICISYSGYFRGKELSHKKLQLSTRQIGNNTLVIKDDEILETDFGKIVLQVEDENYLIRLFLNNLEDAEKVNSEVFIKKLQAAGAKVPGNRKKTNIWLIENSKEEFNLYLLDETPPLTLDMLELNAGVGAGWVYNQFVSSFNFRLGFAFAKKGIMKNKYFADYEVLYDFSNSGGENKFDVNGFLSLGYERNFSLDPNKAKWYGVSVGYLVDKGNEFFERNTFKIAVHKQLSNSISLQPEIYFNDFFKNGSPALRVQISF
ncbi:MAG: hypothetical protein HQ522_08785 [Bacteroidetes bacterium]|nr:hypothetical protein [Bacteroidota bacterium]